jgi:hypothetical protein
MVTRRTENPAGHHQVFTPSGAIFRAWPQRVTLAGRRHKEMATLTPKQSFAAVGVQGVWFMPAWWRGSNP